MNKIKKVAIISIATICLACNNVFAETKEINTATRVRKEASTESGIVTVLYPGNDVEVLSKDGEWSKIKRGDYTGYVKTEFLKELEDKDEEIETTNKVKNEVKNEIKNEVKNTVKTENKITNTVTNNTVKNEVITSDNIITDTLQTLPEGKIAILIKTELNVLPNFFSNSITELDAGTELNIVDEINNWYKVSTSNETQGWILKSKTTNKVLKSEYLNALDFISKRFKKIYDNYGRDEGINPIEHMKYRIKSDDKIIRKLYFDDREVNFDNIYKFVKDVAGFRIVCSFLSDVPMNPSARFM